MEKQKFFTLAAPLLLVLFIDGMGLGLVFPILNAIIVDPQSNFLDAALSPTLHNYLYGLIIALFMLSWFFGAAILGDLSDRIGRKKSLVICLVGAFIGYLISAVSVSLHSISLLMVGRVIAGLTSGSQPIAQAAIVDLSTDEHKARNIGFILLALSLGFIFGPLFGGILSNNQLVSWFDLATPFYFAAILSMLNVVLLHKYFRETFTATKAWAKIKPLRALNLISTAFSDVNIRHLAWIFFIFVFGWSSYYSFVSMYLLQVFKYSTLQITLFMAAMGLGFGLGNGIIMDFISKRLPLKHCYLFGILLGILCVLVMAYVRIPVITYSAVVLLAICMSVAYAAILTLFSNQVSADSQGWIMGITGSIMAFVWGINAIIVGFLATWNIESPIIIAIVGLALTAMLANVYIKPKAIGHASEVVNVLGTD